MEKGRRETEEGYMKKRVEEDRKRGVEGYVGRREEGNGEERRGIYGEKGDGHGKERGVLGEDMGGHGHVMYEDRYNENFQEVGAAKGSEKIEEKDMSTLGDTNFLLVENNLQADIERMVNSYDLVTIGRMAGRRANSKSRQRKRKNEATGQPKTKARIVDIEAPDLGSEVSNTLAGSASTENNQ